MASSAPTPLRQALEQRLSRLSAEMEGLFGEVRDRARRELSDSLSQSARRICQAADASAIAATLLDAAAAHAGGCAVFRLEDGKARGEAIRGVGEACTQAFGEFEIPLESAAALAGAAESRDPVVAATTTTEISPELGALIGHAPGDRASIFPIAVRETVPALLYAWGEVQSSALELLAQVAAVAWTALPAARPELVTIAPAAAAPDSPPPPAETAWDRLSADQQRVHLRAQRFARVQVAALRLREADAVHSGRARHDLYGALTGGIDAARQKFQETFFTACPGMVDYLHLELVKTLAQDDAEMLGKNYPGPLL